MNQVIRSKKGVTLIELLAVVVILGIIAAIAVPTIGGLIRRQEQRAAEATWDTIVTAAELYEAGRLTSEKGDPFTLFDLVDGEWVDIKNNKFYEAADLEDEITPANLVFVFNGSNLEVYKENSAVPANLLTVLYIGDSKVLG